MSRANSGDGEVTVKASSNTGMPIRILLAVTAFSNLRTVVVGFTVNPGVVSPDLHRHYGVAVALVAVDSPRLDRAMNS